MSTPIARFPAARPRVVGVVRAGGVRRAPRGVARGLGGSSIVVSRLVRRERSGAAFVRRPARSSAARAARSSGDDGVGGDEASTVGAASDAPPPLPFEVPPPAPAAIAADAPLKAGSIVREILASTRRDFLPAATIICVAGACAQALNLGGTFVLALLNVHDVEVVAVLFLALVNFWKLCCETLARIAQFRNARDVDAGEQTRFARVSLGGAWDAVARAYAAWRLVLFIDARRLLSIAWNSVLTIPIPYLGVVKLLDYALCVPVFLFEGETGARCLERSRELMLGNRLLLLRVALALAGLASLSAGLVVGVFSVLVPTLPALLTETPVADAAAADAAAAAAAVPLPARRPRLLDGARRSRRVLAVFDALEILPSPQTHEPVRLRARNVPPSQPSRAAVRQVLREPLQPVGEVRPRVFRVFVEALLVRRESGFRARVRAGDVVRMYGRVGCVFLRVGPPAGGGVRGARERRDQARGKIVV